MAIHTFYRTASFAVFMLFLKMGRSDISVAPNNSEAKIGGSTYFNCSTSVTSEEIHWFHYPIGNQDRSFVFGFGQFYTRYIGRFAMENNATTGGYNLVITSVVAEDAGKYECQDEAGRGKKQSGQLIVLATELVCQSNVDVDKVIGPNACGIKLDQLILSCVVQFRGNEAPILQWRLNDSKTITNDVTPRINGSSVVYSLAIRNDKISNGSVYVCETTRSTTKNSCESGKVKVVGSTETPGASDGDSSCAGQTNAVICLVVLFILSLSIIVILIILILKAELRGNIRDRFLRITRSTKQPNGKKDQEIQNAENEETAASALLEKSEVSEKEEPQIMAEMSTKLIQDENEHCEKLRKRVSQSSNIIEQNDKIIDELKTKNEQPQDEKHELKVKLCEMKKKIKQLEDEKQELKVKLCEMKKKIKQLEDEKQELEGRLYPTAITDYYDKPTLVATIEMTDLKADSQKEKKPIFGMTILHNKLCVITENSSEVAVYDSVTFKPETPWHIDGMSNPQDITSCSINGCLYICDGEPYKEKFILRVDSNKTVLKRWTIEKDKGRLSVSREANVVVEPDEGRLSVTRETNVVGEPDEGRLSVTRETNVVGEPDKGRLSVTRETNVVGEPDEGRSSVTREATVVVEPDEGRLSVTREANVVVSLFNGNRINEYTPNGDLIRTVRLSPADSISHPWHAIKTTSKHFIFSHGIGDDLLQRVCVADVDGKIRKSFGGKKGTDIKEQHMNRPVHLLEDSSRNILVADMKNKRVILLSPSLEFKGMLVSAEKCNLKFPMRICLDEEKGILFVADNNYKKKVRTHDSGRILIFNCKGK